MFIYSLVGLGTFLAGWFLCHWWLLYKTDGSTAANYAYEVRLTRNSSHGTFSKVIYSGDDLQVAKEKFKTAVGPARTTAELYTRGNHTASRKV